MHDVRPRQGAERAGERRREAEPAEAERRAEVADGRAVDLVRARAPRRPLSDRRERRRDHVDAVAERGQLEGERAQHGDRASERRCGPVGRRCEDDAERAAHCQREHVSLTLEMSLQSSAAAGVRDRLVLGYHGVSDVVSSRQTVSQGALRRQLAKLLDRRLRRYDVQPRGARAAASPRLAVTFDDGERNVLEHAFPVLSELGIPGTVFVPVGAVGRPGLLDWDELACLADAGWEIGSHSLSHACLTHLDDDALDDELRSSREAIENRLGRPCRSIAYPYGAVRRACPRCRCTRGLHRGLHDRRHAARRRARLAARGRRRQRRQRPLQAEDEQARPLAPRHPSARPVRPGRSRDPPARRPLGPVRHVGHLLGDQPVPGDRHRSQVCRGESPRLEAGLGETRRELRLVVDRHL